jgi:uncharacterized protein (DUF924 family)
MSRFPSDEDSEMNRTHSLIATIAAATTVGAAAFAEVFGGGSGLPAIAEALARETTPRDAVAVVEFWREAGPKMWFAKDPAFDKQFRERFIRLYEAAARGELHGWLETADGALALVLLLDQYPRNSFRGTAKMYATDALARATAAEAIVAGLDRVVSNDVAVFFYLPYAHSENLADQDRCVELVQRLGPKELAHAVHHRDIIKRFGRFPHRNPILGREMKPEEQRYLDEGGYQG